MHLQILSALLAASALALPSPATTNDNDIILNLPAPALNDAAVPRVQTRQEQCDVDYCTQLYHECVTSCASLTDGDW